MTPCRSAIPILLTAALLAGPGTLRPATAAAPSGLYVPPDFGAERMRERKAVSGHAFTVDGKSVTLEGLVCPGPETDEGRRAKALLNQFLHTSIACNLTARSATLWFGSCIANGRDVAQALIGTGLCTPG